jgi:hypothetical protein
MRVELLQYEFDVDSPSQPSNDNIESKLIEIFTHTVPVRPKPTAATLMVPLDTLGRIPADKFNPNTLFANGRMVFAYTQVLTIWIARIVPVSDPVNTSTIVSNILSGSKRNFDPNVTRIISGIYKLIFNRDLNSSAPHYCRKVYEYVRQVEAQQKKKMIVLDFASLVRKTRSKRKNGPLGVR